MIINLIGDAGWRVAKHTQRPWLCLTLNTVGSHAWRIDLIARAVAGREKLHVLTWKRQCGPFKSLQNMMQMQWCSPGIVQ